MRSLLFLVLLPSVALAQAPGATPPANAPPPSQQPTPPPADEPAPPPADKPAAAPEDKPAPAPEDKPTADSEFSDSSSTSAPTSAPAPTPTSTTSPAPAAPNLAELTPDAVPEKCKPLAKEAASPSINRALSAKISLASCLADHKLKPLVLCDCEASVLDINAATQLPLALLDDVYAKGDPAMKILARQAKGDLLASLVQRMQATIPPVVTPTAEAVALRDTRLDMLQPMIEPWQTQARAAYTDVDRIAKANPQLAKNPAVLAAVRASRTKLGAQPTQTATR